MKVAKQNKTKNTINNFPMIWKVIIVVIVGFSLGYILSRPLKPESGVRESNLTSAPTPVQPDQKQSSGLPIPADGKNVIFYGFNYIFKGNVNKFDKKGDIYKLELTQVQPTIPVFDLNDRTVVVKVIGRNQSPATLDDIIKGSRISVAAFYDVRTKSWKTNRIFVFENTSENNSQ